MASYKVGYGKPPIEHRWIKGESGNPSGRKRERKLEKSSAEMLQDILSQKVTATTGGKKQRITLFEMALRNYVMSTVNDPKAFQKLLNLKQVFRMDD